MVDHDSTTIDARCLPDDFGLSWEAFAHEWCLDGTIGYSRSEAIRALNALKLLWPEKVAKLVAGPSRGLSIVAGAVEIGKLLADCENVHRFREVRDRLKDGERSAYSELVLGSSLIGLGYNPSFSAELNGKVLDARCEAEGHAVYFEVLTPERADQSIVAEQSTDRLGKAIRSSVSACRIEVEVLATLDTQIIQQIADAARDAEPGGWLAVGSVARIRRINEGQRLPATFDGDGASIVIAGEREVQGASTGLVIRWEDNDERAKRLFNTEYHHFSEEVPNVLVVNVCVVGMDAWTNWMHRVLQPKQNRKVGAVVLFRQGSVGPPEAIRRRWKVIVNPYSRLAIPESLVKGFESLDVSAG